MDLLLENVRRTNSEISEIIFFYFFRQTKIFIMNQAIVTAFAILLVMGAVVQKGDSYIRAGREMVYNNQGKPMQFADDLFDRPEVRRSSRPFKKG